MAKASKRRADYRRVARALKRSADYRKIKKAPKHGTSPRKLAKAPELAEPAIPARALWIAILVMTFFTAVLLVVFFFPGPLSWNTGRDLITLLLMATFSQALLVALASCNAKLLYYTGLLEFIVLALPMLTLQQSPVYTPYNITPPFIFAFPVLWLLLPVALMRIMKSRARRKAFFCILLLVSAAVAASTALLCGAGRELQHNCLLTLSPVWLLPLLVWYLSYRQANASAGRHGRGVWARLGIDPSVFALVAAFVCIMAFGFWTGMQPVTPQDVCGNGICSLRSGEDCYTCVMDCGTCMRCGDGYCDGAETMTGCPEDCSATVTVQLDTTPLCMVTVRLYAGTGGPITQKSARNKFVFQNVVSQTANVQVSGPGGISQNTPAKTLQPGNNIVQMSLEPGICDMPPPQALWLTVNSTKFESAAP